MLEKKVLITDCDHGNVDVESETFKKAEISFDLEQCKTEEDLISKGKGFEVFINQYAPVTRSVIENLPDLKLVVRYGVGVDNVDIAAATEHGVQVCNVPDYGMNEVADQALAMMLNFTRSISRMNSFVRKGVWDYQKSMPLYRHSEQTVGVIGVGRIGSSFAKKVKSLGCRVVAYDPKYLDEKAKKSPDFIDEFLPLNELLEQADVVSIHCPLDKARNLIDEKELQKMKPTAYLINVSRGGIINEQALNKALTNQWIAGAAVDVAENEPLQPESALLEHDNFICTPHMGWYSEQAALELKRKVAEESIRHLNGDQVHYPINFKEEKESIQ
ncbi:dehydrogenase [Oceanobacillus iheyensis HTE831]|uniref:Dehydrogenase n=1 Tax=Oceanobacillus iheyensis (strain DSM 14371 / CIP 107618 / JCM 11309 / KCTC 3954 / HTE831) TaxID=221109 RepID=Q8EMM3_OCEIH|nr:C-terminal binding protein [Oceanobacillus iheyensis]BAC14775.1 dehydrogenase [Oceanobacillus iheyensis HTE831]